MTLTQYSIYTDSDLQTFLTDLSYGFKSILHVKVDKYKMENIRNSIASPSSSHCRKTSVNMKVCGLC
jgi:hypothetical protein